MTNSRVNLRLKSSFTGTIYDHIKKLIFDGTLKPSQRITVQEFASYFNVSITPVREAFQRLLAENYLSSNNANRNELRVINLTPEEVDDIYELYRALDIWGVKKNIARLTEKFIADLTAMHDALTLHYRKSQLKSYFRQNYEFHAAIWKACQNDFIYQTMVSAQNKISIYIGLFPEHFYSPDVLARSYGNHCELMEALAHRDIARLEKVLERHWGEGFFQRANLGPKGLELNQTEGGKV